MDTPKKKAVRASRDKIYVFPDGTRITWAESTFRVCINPAKDHGIVLSAGSFGGMVAVVSWPKDSNGNPSADAFTQHRRGK